MMMSIILDVLLAVAAVSMFAKGQYGVTRQVALAPLLVAVLDVSFISVVDFSLTPVLSSVLIGLQLVVLCASGLALYQDVVRIRNRAARRRRRREILRSREAFETAATRQEQTKRVCA